MEKRTVINTTIRVSFAVTPDLVCDGCEKCCSVDATGQSKVCTLYDEYLTSRKDNKTIKCDKCIEAVTKALRNGVELTI